LTGPIAGWSSAIAANGNPAGTGYVDVRAYAELNDFLPPESRGAAVRRPFRSHQTVKDALEAMASHTEIDLILVKGSPQGFGHRPSAGDRIAAYPMFEALDVGWTVGLRPAPLRDPRFVVDVNLGRLARLLRVLGFDVWWSSDAGAATLADVSLAEQRILLTRDRGLLKRRAITHGLFVHSQHPEEQALEVIRRLDLARDHGVVCDQCSRALGAPHVHAVGDVARWFHPRHGRLVRIEHWTNAVEQATCVAHNIVNPDGPRAYVSVEYVWSDQYDWRIQLVGRTGGDLAHVTVAGKDAASTFAVLFADRHGSVCGAVTVNWPRALIACRRALATAHPLGEVQRAVEATLKPASAGVAG
jgi:uncharacterized protein with PIN domain